MTAAAQMNGAFPSANPRMSAAEAGLNAMFSTFVSMRRDFEGWLLTRGIDSLIRTRISSIEKLEKSVYRISCPW